MPTAAATPEWARVLPDLASLDTGSEIVFATDEWFAPATMLLQSHDPVWKEDEFTPQGKWMDGWESRRKRTEGHDWCIIKLGLAGTVHGFLLDTAFFTGNQVPCCSIMGIHLDSNGAASILKGLRTKGEIGTCATADQVAAAEKELKSLDWFQLLPEMTLRPGYPDTRLHYFQSSSKRPITHLRVNYFPDGGVARLRAFGEVTVAVSPGGSSEIDVLAVENGGVALAWSNEHYGVPRNMLLPHPAPNMGNGWETARNPNRPKILRRGDDGQIVFVGKDWAVFKLAAKSELKRALIDTNHFKGNFPESAVIEGLDAPELAGKDLIEQRRLFVESDSEVPAPAGGATWKTLMPRTKMEAHCQRSFDLLPGGPVTHVRLTILPDGGVSRLRLFGTTMRGSARL